MSTPHTRDKKCLRRTARAASNHVPAVFSSIVAASNHVPVHSPKSGNAQVRGLEHRVSSKVRQAHALSSQLAPQILTTQDFERGCWPRPWRGEPDRGDCFRQELSSNPLLQTGCPGIMYAQKSQKHVALGPFSGGHLNFLASRSPSAWPSVSPWPGSRQATGIDFLSFPVQSVKNTVFLAGWTAIFGFSVPPAPPGLARCRPLAWNTASQGGRVSNSGFSKVLKKHGFKFI